MDVQNSTKKHKTIMKLFLIFLAFCDAKSVSIPNENGYIIESSGKHIFIFEFLNAIIIFRTQPMEA